MPQETTGISKKLPSRRTGITCKTFPVRVCSLLTITLIKENKKRFPKRFLFSLLGQLRKKNLANLQKFLFNPLNCRYGNSCQFCHITDRIVFFQQSNNFFVFFPFLFYRFDTAWLPPKFPPLLDV